MWRCLGLASLAGEHFLLLFKQLGKFFNGFSVALGTKEEEKFFDVVLVHAKEFFCLLLGGFLLCLVLSFFLDFLLGDHDFVFKGLFFLWRWLHRIILVGIGW